MNAKKKVLKKKVAQSPSFEDAFRELEQVVQRLESSQSGLTDSLTLYEKGVGCLKVCYQALESAERKIELLTGVNEEGEAETEPFDDEPSSAERGAGRRPASGNRTSRNRAIPRSSSEEGEDAEDAGGVDDGGRLF